MQISTPPGRGSPPPGPGVGTAMVALPLWADPLPTTHTWPIILRHTNCWESVLKCETPAHCAEHLGKRVLYSSFIYFIFSFCFFCVLVPTKCGGVARKPPLAGVGIKPLIRHGCRRCTFLLPGRAKKEICPDHFPILPTASLDCGLFSPKLSTV